MYSAVFRKTKYIYVCARNTQLELRQLGRFVDLISGFVCWRRHGRRESKTKKKQKERRTRKNCMHVCWREHRERERERERERIRIRIRIVHKEANFDLWGPEYTCVLHICLLLKKGYLYVEAQSLYALIKHTHMSLTFQVVSLSMDLKLSLPLSMSTYLERISLYVEHVKSK